MSAEKWVYYFGEGSASDKALLGGKGANLSEMTKLGLPIPSGFTITTRACIAFQDDMKHPAGMDEQVEKALARLEAKTGQRLGDMSKPLLVSVRSGAKISMPGMMDTVLNLGLNDAIVQVVVKNTNNKRFAFDSYRRFIQMFSDVVMGIDRMLFEEQLDKKKEERGAKHDTDLTAEDLESLIPIYKQIYQRETGTPFPQDPKEQLWASVDAVFKSWNNSRAIKYRKLNDIPHDLGTAVNVQAMVFGNMGNDCATGVGFTRNPSTGENRRFGEYLMNAQGEDVVAGIRTPKDLDTMKAEMPAIHKQLMDMMELLENHYRDMQDIEFTIQNGILYLLQTRNGKRTAAAAIKMAVDMVHEKLITDREAVLRVTPKQVDTMLHPQLDPKAKKKSGAIAKGLPASPGAAVGQIAFTAEKAVEMKNKGLSVVLVRLETSPEDIQGMAAAQGILTARGGMTSHAAVVARGMNVCCVAGCGALTVKKDYVAIGNQRYREGDWMSLDGTSGEVFHGRLDVIPPATHGDFAEFLSFADKYRTLGVRANADTPEHAKVALEFGAQGIGLTRTEHMFFAEDRIMAVREMILAKDNPAGRQKALAKLLPFQREDFYGILGTMSGLPVVIRLIDPPLHEFLPKEIKECQDVADAIGSGVTAKQVSDTAASLHEVNPMLGFRGCRLGVVYPDINAMQIRAIFEASVRLVKEGKRPLPCIEIPLVGNLKEYLPLKALVEKLAVETGAKGVVEYEVGTMIEVPRAALTADELALHVDFMSFGTNDLTQMTCGFSRDDAGTFLKDYVAKDIYAKDPFQSIDQVGVGKLMKICVALARSTHPRVDIGICGEHGGDPKSVEFCHQIGLDNVSCSPYRVPVARLAAAQAAIKYGKPPPPQIQLRTPSTLYKSSL